LTRNKKDAASVAQDEWPVPPHGGRWRRDPATGALTLEDETPAEAETADAPVQEPDE
jgi:hypothetical protein